MSTPTVRTEPKCKCRIIVTYDYLVDMDDELAAFYKGIEDAKVIAVEEPPVPVVEQLDEKPVPKLTKKQSRMVNVL